MATQVLHRAFKVTPQEEASEILSLLHETQDTQEDCLREYLAGMIQNSSTSFESLKLCIKTIMEVNDEFIFIQFIRYCQETIHIDALLEYVLKMDFSLKYSSIMWNILKN